MYVTARRRCLWEVGGIPSSDTVIQYNTVQYSSRKMEMEDTNANENGRCKYYCCIVLYCMHSCFPSIHSFTAQGSFYLSHLPRYPLSSISRCNAM